MPTTSKGLRYPASSAAPNIPQDIQDLATDVGTALPGVWLQAQSPDTNFSQTLTTTFAQLTGMAMTVVVPAGRYLDIEFHAPAIHVTGGISYVQIVVNSVTYRVGIYSIGAGDVWVPVRLGATAPGGATANISVQGRASTGSAAVVGGGFDFIQLRARII